MLLHMDLKENGYDIRIERGALARVGGFFSLDRRVFIVSDSGVPTEYVQAVAAQCKVPIIETIPMGEESKCLATYEQLLLRMIHEGFTRSDCVVAVGGGVVGDLAGFVAASYMRGIDFYNIPTTLLSQVDSSIGGKVAIDLGNVKNIVGAFYQPCGVLIDPDVLQTLPARQLACGFAEALKMSLTSDAELFALFEKGLAAEKIDRVIERSLAVKKTVVEQDEKENGLRRVLNFGHTLGHGIEAEGSDGYYHGECVALGMLPMCSKELKKRLLPILVSLGLPTTTRGNADRILELATHDKKCIGADVSVVYVSTPGQFEIRKQPMDAWISQMRNALNEMTV